jgi:hypothetical protein
MASEDTAVDVAPLSPVRSTERRNSLEKHLQHRPEAQDLKNRHILIDTTTAPYVARHSCLGARLPCLACIRRPRAST